MADERDLQMQIADMFPGYQRLAVTAEVIESDQKDVRELISAYIPERKDMKVLELGAGIGLVQ